jgi:hypothetical protein
MQRSSGLKYPPADEPRSRGRDAASGADSAAA